MSILNDDAQAAEPAKPAQHNLSPTPRAPHGSTPGADASSDGALTRREQILRKLELLPGLVAAGILTPQKANSMRSIYQALLANLDDTHGAASAQIPDENVLKVLHKAPELLALIQPFLTPQQVALIVENAPLD